MSETSAIELTKVAADLASKTGWSLQEASEALRSLSEVWRLREALELIDLHGCHYYTRGRCLDNDGRTRGAKYASDAWCDACIARDALRGRP